jgi:GABA(A) receptor-associated protein
MTTKIFVIIEKGKESQLPDLYEKEYKFPNDLLMGQLQFFIRKKIKLSPEKAIFCFVNNSILCPVSYTIGQIYEQHKSDDNKLHIIYEGENTFGN